MRASILILCTGNSARSQMAEGLMRSFDAGLDVHSAGTKPAERVHPAAVEAMREIGIDIAACRPKSVAQYLGRDFDFVLTVCDHARETCPVFTGRVRHRVHIGFEDPAAATGSPDEVLEVFRRVRDEIRARLYRFYLTAGGGNLRPAVESDLEAVSALLQRCDLPLDGLTGQFGPQYVIAESEGAILGVAGVEVYGRDGLLRSVAVARASRGSGLGAALVGDRITWARAQGLRAVYLLTTTAVSYFPKLGFEIIARDLAPEAIRASTEFVHACPASAVLMRLATGVA